MIVYYRYYNYYNTPYNTPYLKPLSPEQRKNLDEKVFEAMKSGCRDLESIRKKLRYRKAPAYRKRLSNSLRRLKKQGKIRYTRWRYIGE